MTRLLALLTLNTLVACSSGKVDGDDGGASDGGSGDGGSGDGGSTDQGWCAVQAILADQCAICHDADSPSGDLDLETNPYAALVNQPSIAYAGRTLVVPGDPDGSFLVVKVEGTQGASEGDPMPEPDGLDAAQVAEIRDWITAGATDDCSGGDGGSGDGGSGDYHPEGYDEDDVHGLEAKLHVQTCTDCHGADLAGGDAGVSCDGCHDDGWRTDCTFCHGNVDNATGAPPESIDDSDTDVAFGAHTRHVEENTHSAFDCEQCHTKPTDVLSPGHLFDSTAAVAEVQMGDGLSPSGTWNSGAQSCSNLYCHGNGRGNNGSVSVSEAPLDCGSCHPGMSSSRTDWGAMSGEHEEHLREGLSCDDCHHATTTTGTSITGVALHVNGDVDLESTQITISGSTCSGNCHGENHNSERWD